MTFETIALAIAAGACGVAAYTDLAYRRVPNALTLPLMAAAPILAAPAGWRAVVAAIAIVAISLVAGTFVHALGVLGGGDVKLLAGVGALAGFPACINVALYTGVVGGLLAIAVSAMRGELGGVMTRVRGGVVSSIAGRNLAIGVASIDTNGVRIPYALAIGAGFAIAMLAQSAVPFLRIIR